MRISERIAGVRQWLGGLGYTGERRAAALLPLSIFGLLYLVLSLNAQPGWGPALFGLSLSYLVAFFALASGWFWARWFASGLGWSGFMVGVMALVMFGWQPALGIYAGMHALVVVALMGPKMSEAYELRPGWRERFAMDDFGVARLGKAVTRGAGALPTLILWALAPREGTEWLQSALAPAETTVVAIALGLLVLGLAGLARLRSFAVLALGAAALAAGVGVVLATSGLTASLLSAGAIIRPSAWYPVAAAPLPILTLLFLSAATLPFARPLYRYLTR
ncbi:MAG TPA: hypothetical protein VGG33_21080 [Polyangia bacterium]